MKSQSFQNCLWSCGVLLGLMTLSFESAWADPFNAAAFNGSITRVEEDWEFQVFDPELNKALPQIACVIAPQQELEEIYAIFEINHATCPEFMAGGMQLQIWRHDWIAACKNFPKFGCMSTSQEKVNFTSSMAIVGAGLQFEILKGSSTTWGAFGGQGYLKATLSSPLNSLNQYTPEFSVENSGIVRGAHNVKYLVLKEVRYYNAVGLVATDNSIRAVHEYVEQVGVDPVDGELLP